MEGDIDCLPSDKADIAVGDEDGPLHAAEDEGGLNKSRGSPILNTPTLGLKYRNKARRMNQHMSRGDKESVASWQVSCRPASSVENELQTDFIIPKTPVQRGTHQISQLYCESDSEDMFASDTSECEEEIIPSNLNALINGPEISNLSWTSSMATPVAGNVTCSNLNTEERKVLLPSEDCDILGVKPRALFTPDQNDSADCHSLNMSSDLEYLMAHKKEMCDVTPKMLQRISSTAHKIFKESPLVTNATPNCALESSQEFDEDDEKVTAGSPILSGSSEYKKTPRQFKEMFQGEDDLFENVESPNCINLHSQSSKESKDCGGAESTPNAESRRCLNRVEELSTHRDESDIAEAFMLNTSDIASRAQKRDNSAVSSTPGKHLDAKRRRLLFSPLDAALNSSMSVFKAPEDKPAEKAMTNCTSNELIPDDSFSEHLAAMNTSIFSDPVAPVTKIQAIKSSASHMKKFCYSLGEQKPELDDVKDCLSSKPQSLMEEILKSVLAQETSKAVTGKKKPVKPSGNLIMFSQLLSNETDHIEDHPKTTAFLGADLNLSADKVFLDVKSEGFQTASGNSIIISQEALNKGLHCLEGAMQDVNTESVKLSPTLPLCSGGTSVMTKLTPHEAEPKSFSNDQILQAEEEVKQLLQLVKSGEDFDPWHENEQALQAKQEELKIKVTPGTPEETTSSVRMRSSDCTKVPELGAFGFATARGKNIFISETNLAKAEKLLEFENEPDDLTRKKDIKSNMFTPSKNFSDESNLSTSLADTVNVMCREKRFESPKPGHENSSVCSIPLPEVSDDMKMSDEAFSFLTRPIGKSKKESPSVSNCAKSTIFLEGGGRIRNASENASSKARFLQNDPLGDCDTSPKSMGFETLDNNADSSKNTVWERDCDEPVGQKLQAEVHILSKSEATSFTTASGKSVSVSKQALKKVESLFVNLDDECPGHQEVKTETSSSKLNGEHDLEDVGLLTARKHQAAVSTVTDAQKLSPSKMTLLSKSKTVDRSSVNNKRATVSEDSLLSGSKLFTDCNTDIPLLPTKLTESDIEKVCFSTGSGKTVHVSRESLKKVEGLFSDLSSVIATKEDSTKSIVVKKDCAAHFSTASGKFVSVSKDSLNRAKEILGELSSEGGGKSAESETLSCKQVPDFQENQTLGFCTANGNTVSVSEEAMQKVKELFDAEDTSLDLKDLLSTQSWETGSRNAVKVESNSFDSNFQSVKMSGFLTAGGKDVHITKKALSKAKHLFDDLNSQPSVVLPENSRKEDIGVVGQTCDDISSVVPNPSVAMAGFSTAGGRDVLISREALNKAKHLFNDVDSESSVFPPENSLLEKSEHLIKQSFDIKHNGSPNVSVTMAGFSTARGKDVLISKEALSRAKTLFDDPASEDNSLLVTSKINKTCNSIEDDSGVFLSHENTPNESSVNKSLNLFGNLCKTFPNIPNCGNKENCTGGQTSIASRTDFLDDQKVSLTQEISESTAALLADEADSISNSMQTISTSPSMATDRCSSIKPILTSASENKFELDGPTSPILMKSDNRRRSRKGRLSLSNVSGRGSLSQTLGSQPTSSQGSLSKSRGSLSSSTCYPTVPEGSKDLRISDLVESPHLSNAVEGVQPSPSRKLFVDDNMSSNVLHRNAKEKMLSEAYPQSPGSPDTEAPHVAKSSHPVPLVKRVLSRNLSAQSSGFKTPYKQASKEQLKRTPPSPLPNPPEAKRRRSSNNLYVSINQFLSSERSKSGTRVLRPEVEEMRRRAAEEQKQLAVNYAELKGELLEPCTGSWLTGKTSGGDPMMKLAQLGLPGVFSCDDLIKVGLRPSTVSLTSENARDFRFSAWDFYSEDMCRENVAGLPVGDGAFLVLDPVGTAGVEEIERSFLASPGVDPSLVPPGWIKNHYRWIVWKLAAYEWRFPYRFGQKCLSPNALMLQLKYRYDREIDRCERPALRRIFEHDDSAAKRMVLCVASIIKSEDTNHIGSGLELELTDGWYGVITSIDQDMQHRVRKGVICVGTKLVMHGAELINSPDGCYPLQARPEARLKISSNATRRARWYAKLGFQDNPGPIRIALSSILSSGGIISCVSAYIARVYPIIFMQKTEERTVVRSQRAELKEVAKRERKQQQEAEIVYSKVQAEVLQEQSKPRLSSVKLSVKYVSTLTSGEDLIELLENSSDPLSIQNMLTEDQKNVVSDYQRRKQEELCQEVENRVRLRLSENSQHERHITPILKIRLVDSTSGKQSNCAMLSVYRPSEDVASIFIEGHKLSIFGAVANGLRCGELQLSANRSTRYNEESCTEIMPGLARSFTPLHTLLSYGFLPRFGELDIVGVVVGVSPAPKTSENSTPFQTVYVSDSQLNIIGISFREGMKEFGVEDLLAPHSLIVASNLQWRGGPVVRPLPCVFACELSTFTSNPRQKNFQTALQELRCSLPSDLKSFCQGASEKLCVLLKQKVSMPIGCQRTPNPSSSVLKQEDLSSNNQNSCVQNLSPIKTPTHVKAQQNLSMERHLTPPSSSNILSPAVEKRIAKLEMYGEPPPLSPIIGSQPRRLRKSFNPPRQARRTDSPLVDRKNV